MEFKLHLSNSLLNKHWAIPDSFLASSPVPKRENLEKLEREERFTREVYQKSKKDQIQDPFWLGTICSGSHSRKLTEIQINKSKGEAATRSIPLILEQSFLKSRFDGSCYNRVLRNAVETQTSEIQKDILNNKGILNYQEPTIASPKSPNYDVCDSKATNEKILSTANLKSGLVDETPKVPASLVSPELSDISFRTPIERKGDPKEKKRQFVLGSMPDFDEVEAIRQTPMGNGMRLTASMRKIKDIVSQNSPKSNFEQEAPGHFFEELFQGTWESGFGRVRYGDGSVYSGGIFKRKREGFGKMQYIQGGSYEGQWKNDMIEGYGVLSFSNGEIAYKGNWSNNQFEGEGELYNDSPSKEPFFNPNDLSQLGNNWLFYRGHFHEDMKHGNGELVFLDGYRYLGHFENDLPHFHGALLQNGQQLFIGVWKEGKALEFSSGNLNR